MICLWTKCRRNKSIACVNVDTIHNVTETKQCTNRNTLSRHGVPEIDATSFFHTKVVDYNNLLRFKCDNQEF